MGDQSDGAIEAARKEWNANLMRWFLNRRTEDPVNLRRALDKAASLGMAVVLTMGQDLDPAIPDRDARYAAYWNDDKHLDELVARWLKIAELCKDRPQPIWFDLLNEPLNWTEMPRSPRKWPLWAQRLIDEIRKVDAHHPIVVEPGPGGLCWGFRNFPLLKGHDIIYSVHMYQPHEYTHQGIADIKQTDLARAYLERQRPWPGTYGENTADSGGMLLWNAERLREALAPAIEFQQKHGVRILLGEFSAARWAPNAPDYLRDCLELFEQLGWDWVYHAYRESTIWSLEHTEEYGPQKQAKLATTRTKRAEIVAHYLQRNK